MIRNALPDSPGHSVRNILGNFYVVDYLSGKIKIINNSKLIIDTLSRQIGERTIDSYDNLQAAKRFIINYMRKTGGTPVEESYTVNGRETSNIISEIRGRRHPEEIIIIGAHYDTVEGSPGANDNGSGIAALLELHRIFAHQHPHRTLRFVAFTLEEPPFFDSEQMGSMVHLNNCLQKGENISLMIALDMLGYAGLFVRQEFPTEDLKEKYPSTGDFLSVVTVPSMSQYAYRFKRLYNHYADNQIHDLIAPASLAGVNHSDHLGFYRAGIPALMISDTGPYRNKNYHDQGDRYETVNFRFLTDNIINLYHTIRNLINSPSLAEESPATESNAEPVNEQQNPE